MSVRATVATLPPGLGCRPYMRVEANAPSISNSPAEIAHKLDVLATHCDTEGRDPATIDKTILAMINPLDDPDGFVAQMAEYAKLSIDAVEVMPMGDPIAYTTQVGERIVPALRQLGP